MKRVSAIVLACIIALTIASATFAAAGQGRTLACPNPHCSGTLSRQRLGWQTESKKKLEPEPAINHITGQPTMATYIMLYGYWDTELVCSQNSSHRFNGGKEKGEQKQLMGYAD